MNNIEIERKYIIRKMDISFNYKKYDSIKITQGFIYLKPAVRIRKSNDKYYFAIKSKPPKNIKAMDDLVRTEYEIEIPKKAFMHFSKYVIGHMIKKTRYLIPFNKYTIELDVFEGEFKGLIYAEVEFNSVKEAEEFLPPIWFYKNVTGINKYKNTQLSICKNIKNLLKY